ncbi:murein transglycosylase [Capronia epimyces CBS 606.96]|uniref:Probable glucan endo-1,3-beta-glucosidase eglC n=1 Tax=Capronia epimyces CBS 606.96 TaxID=1182542 RepID=W9YC97_9EURO|nr:murein transglycosylase [Capronia epimyces CBS 606.96]EXJ79954.1 murein transglycosylase [Capronia epimyces CBS 606.96]
MKASILALLGGASAALAAVRGFNYASQSQTYDTFSSQFKIAASLTGANDFTSARLYTMIQDGTTSTPITAIQAAIDTKTTLLLGLWASADQATFENEITALKSAIQQYGSDFADLVVGISVGSEDLYRISPIGIAAGSGAGQTPDVLVNYIGLVRDAIKGTSLATKPVGHVDTWNVFVNDTNSEVISNCDFLGLDEYPYYQTTDENSIGNSGELFFEAYDKVAAVAGGKPIWITESGWPTSGPTSNLAVASVDNAEAFWQDVACELEHRDIDFWWYILADAGASPSFGVSENGKPLYNLACNSTSGFHTSSTSSSTASATGNSSSTATASGSHTSHASTNGAGTTTESGSETASATGSASTSTVVETASAGGSGSGSGSSGSSGTSGGTPAQATVTASATSTGANSAYTGAASKIEGSIAGLVIVAGVAAFAL